MFNKKSIAVVLLLGLLVLTVVGCGQQGGDQNQGADQKQQEETAPKEVKEEDKFGGVFEGRVASDPPSLDPAHITDTTSHKVAMNIYDGLVEFDKDLKVVGAIAKSWDVSDDGLIWTFKLKKDVKFHNGDLVTAEDFVYSFTRMVNPETKSERAWLFNNIKGVEEFQNGKTDRVEGIKATDEYTLKITLKEPFTPFLSVLAMPNAAVVSKKAIEKYGVDYGNNPVGTGPFKFKEWQHDNKVVLEAHKDYFAGRPYLDKVVYRVIPEASPAFAEYEQGNIYTLVDGDIPMGQMQRVLTSEKFSDELVKIPFLGTYYFGINTNKEPFDNLKVRKALNYAVNKKAIAKVLKNGTVKPASGILPPGMPGYNEDIEGYPYDQEKAKKLLAEAGYPDGLPGEYELIYNTSKSHQAIAEAVQANLKEIGVNIKLSNLDWGSYIKRVDNGETQIFRLGWIADYPDPDNFLYVKFHSENAGPGGNAVFYNNPEFDKIAEKARGMKPGEERLKLYQKAEKMVVNDAPWIPIYYYTRVAVAKPFVQGYRLTAMGPLPLNTVWLNK
ncbi:ABC transporter substrate-binding protein [Selenihalanaerobacter shriftii]|uniref:Oligopeptide transport system substrate-binding protein n=1 Tax=Selenihalanaerobacter shriftii TaxID=142842 RepID=A0A1T4R398_9FIRM|nr:ABC transporter substrate-binding protein [Selenihalanaerobacter shriftii]SKA10305.1 oligopeptide transport system substrate-binding protein [Selenihalanaerobacter shriftii]